MANITKEAGAVLYGALLAENRASQAYHLRTGSLEDLIAATDYKLTILRELQETDPNYNIEPFKHITLTHSHGDIPPLDTTLDAYDPYSHSLDTTTPEGRRLASISGLTNTHLELLRRGREVYTAAAAPIS